MAVNAQNQAWIRGSMNRTHEHVHRQQHTHMHRHTRTEPLAAVHDGNQMQLATRAKKLPTFVLFSALSASHTLSQRERRRERAVAAHKLTTE